MKREYSYRVEYSYLDQKDGRLNSFIDILSHKVPSEPMIKMKISERWQQVGYKNSHTDMIHIDNVEVAR